MHISIRMFLHKRMQRTGIKNTGFFICPAAKASKEIFMRLYWGIGFGVGLLIAAIALGLRKKLGKPCEYDERQVAVRGKAFQAGFVTIVICEFCVFLTEIITETPFMIAAPGVSNMIIMLIGFLVMLEISIFEDAYFTPGKPVSIKWCIVMLLFGLTMLVRGFTSDDLWNKFMSFSFGTFFIIVMISIIIKAAITKKAVENDAEAEK